MRNPRRIVLDEAFIKKYNLSTDPPPANSLFWTMWNASTEYANAALETAFVQGINAGTLNPVSYGGFNVSDAYYCFNGADDYATAASRAQDPTLRAFLMKKYDSYQKYNQTFPSIWHVRDASGVVPAKVCKEYSEYESVIASHEAAIYCLIVMIPCEYLWYWLANDLSPPKSGNLYAPWITGNDDPAGSYAMGNFIDAYQQENPGAIDVQKAIGFYKTATEYEALNFAAGTDQVS